MIMWTLELLDWVHWQLKESWPKAKLRGGAPDIAPEPYLIRFRDDGKQYWLVLSRAAIQNTQLADVVSLLEVTDWIPTMKETGGLIVDLREPTDIQPVLNPWPVTGPEVRVGDAS
jgi:hypothetical protein